MFSEFAKVSSATWGVIVALLLVGVVVFAVSKDKKRWTARMLANGALCIALSTVLSFITLYKMPQGGSITLASMLPMFLFAYAYGVGPGMLVGAAYGFVQFLQGGLYFVHPVELLLDYPLAFAMLGLAGLSSKFSDQWGMIPGIILGTFGRFVCAFLSGLIFFGMYAPEGQTCSDLLDGVQRPLPCSGSDHLHRAGDDSADSSAGQAFGASGLIQRLPMFPLYLVGKGDFFVRFFCINATW